MSLLKKFQADLQVDGNLTFDTLARTITNSKLIGGTTPTSDLSLQTTSGVGVAGADMHFLTGNNGLTEAMTILNNGNVGIGTVSPSLEGLGKLLNISGTNLAALNLTHTDASGTQALGVVDFSRTNSESLARVVGALDGATDSGAIFFQTQPTGGALSERVRILSTGNVGIGTATPTERLHVVGNIVASGNIGPASSRFFKKDISYVSTKDAMDTLNGLNPVRFKYKDDNTEEEHLGFIAEDVPELVATQSRNHLSIMDFTAVLTKVVQWQQKMLQEQTAAMNEMAKKIDTLEHAINLYVKGL